MRYQAHRFDPDVAIEETIEALQQVVASGKARYLGFGEWTSEQIQAAIDIAGPTCSCPPSRSTRCCGRRPRSRSSRCAPRTGSRRSSGRRRPEVASAIVGASRPEQVHTNARASGIELTPDTLAAIDEALGDAPIEEPTLAPARGRGHPPLTLSPWIKRTLTTWT